MYILLTIINTITLLNLAIAIYFTIKKDRRYHYKIDELTSENIFLKDEAVKLREKIKFLEQEKVIYEGHDIDTEIEI